MEANQKIRLTKKLKLNYSNRCFLTSSRLCPLSLSILERGIQLQFAKRVSITATKKDNGKTSSIKTCLTI